MSLILSRSTRKSLFLVFVMCTLGHAAHWSFSEDNADWSYSGDNADWSYSGDNGPSRWKNDYPACGGRSQSPININGGNLVYSPHPTWKNYNKNPEEMILVNSGHSLVLKGTYGPNAKKPRIEIGNGKVYELANVHFHFGKNDFDGSEHAFQNKKYPLEMHAVHMRVKNGVTLNEIVVVAILFEISKSKNPAIEKFINFATEIRNAETEYHLTPFAWSSLLPQFDTYFFTYQGSLTTPPCSEVVTWIVRNKLGKVSSSQLDMFRLLRNDEGESMAPNFRPLQPLNGREVSYVLP